MDAARALRLGRARSGVTGSYVGGWARSIEPIFRIFAAVVSVVLTVESDDGDGGCEAERDRDGNHGIL